MARKITRETAAEATIVDEPVQVEAKPAVAEQPSPAVTHVDATPAVAKIVKKLNVTIDFKNFLGVRRVGQSIWFNNNRKMRKETIDASKPVRITFEQ